MTVFILAHFYLIILFSTIFEGLKIAKSKKSQIWVPTTSTVLQTSGTSGTGCHFYFGL